MSRTFIGVIGGSRINDPQVVRQAEEVGRRIAEAGAVVVCGGMDGVMAAVCRGAREAGGLTIGILPGIDASEANEWVDLPIVTGEREARNAIIARTAGALIAIDGAYGTLSEIAFGLHFGKPVIGLGTWRVSRRDEDADPIQRADTAADAVTRALAAAKD